MGGLFSIMVHCFLMFYTFGLRAQVQQRFMWENSSGDGWRVHPSSLHACLLVLDSSGPLRNEGHHHINPLA